MPRRAWLLWALSPALLCWSGCARPEAPTPERARPNIVLIVADDLGWSDTGAYGGEYYETPAIDRLARQGMRFTAAYANPNCAPTRAALMTGRYSPRTGVYTVNSGARGLDKFRKLEPAENRTELALSEVTFAEALHDAGYATAHMGKWHLGAGEHGPRGQGFDVNVGGNAAGSPGRDGYFSPYNNPDLPDGPAGEHLTERMAEEAVRYIESVDPERPFLLYLPFYAVHSPIQGKPELIDKYRQKAPAGGHDNPEYAAMVESLDQAVGRVLDSLEAKGAAENTAVFFYSDNGGVGGYADEGIAVNLEVTTNRPLRGGKGMLYEGGVRVPLIARIPGVTPPGAVSDAPVMCVDFLPTLLELAGVAPPADVEIDGTSFYETLRGMTAEAASRPPIFWHFPGYLEGVAAEGAWRTTPAGAIRDGHHKLIEFFETGEIELYNLSQDEGESRNLALVEPRKAAALRERLQEWRTRLAAPMPQAKR